MTAGAELAEPLGLSRPTHIECLNRSTARPPWPVKRLSGTRGSGQLLFWDYAGNCWAFGNRKSIDRSSFKQGPAQLAGKADWA